MFKNWKDPLQWRSWVWGAMLFLVATLPYANTLLNGFVSDDNLQVLDNPYIRSFHYMRQIFGTPVWSFTGFASRYYRPMMTLGYLLCYKVFGLSPGGFHLVNVALHGAIVCLLFIVTNRLFSNRMLAVGSAVIFAIHPIHSEPVNWIAAVTDLELTFFFLLTFWFFLMLDRARGPRLIWLRAAMIVSFALALLSKEQAVTLAPLATIYEHFCRDDRSTNTWTCKFRRYLPLWLLVIAYFPLHYFAVGGFVVTSNYWGLTVRELFFSAAALGWQYLIKLIWPMSLSAFYVFQKSETLLEPPVAAGILSGLLLCAGFWWLWRRSRKVSFGLIWLVVTLAPVMNPKWLGVSVFGERYLYLPSVGFCWVLCWGLARIWTGLAGRPGKGRIAYVMGLTVLGLLAIVRTVTRNSDWHDDLSLTVKALEASPNAVVIRLNLASIHKDAGLMKQAEDEYREILAGDPECADCLNHLGQLLLEEARYADAKEYLEKALRLEPRAVTAHLNLGKVYQKTGSMQLADQQFQKALLLAPQSTRVQIAAASFYQEAGDNARAESFLKKALTLNPGSIQARLALGRLYEHSDRRLEAIREFETILASDPGVVPAIEGLRRLK